MSEGLEQEIATIERDITRALVFGGVLENLDDTLRTRGRGKGLKIYDELERDCHAFAVLQKRKLAVVSRPWQVDPASESAADKAAAELVRAQLQAASFDVLTTGLLDATLKGFAVGEVMWEVRGSELAVARIIPRDQRRFVFDETSRLRMLTREKLWDGVELPPMKFLVHRFGAKDGSPYGLGLGHKLFWPVFFKKQDISFWLVFADKFGSPTGLGKYPGSASKDEQKKLLDALKAIAQDAGIIIPQGMEVELLEAARTGSIDTYEKLARYMDEQISECVLGESITTTPKATGLGSGVADVQNEVRVEIAQADADLLSDTLNATLVRWIIDLNLPGAGYPTIWRVFEDEEDLDKRSQVDVRLHEMGYEPESVEQINETYGGKWKKAAARPMPLPQPGAQFAEPTAALDDATEDQRALERAAESLAGSWEKLIGPRVDELVAMAEATGDMATFRENLAELMRAAPVPALVESLGRGAFTAQLMGRTTGADLAQFGEKLVEAARIQSEATGKAITAFAEREPAAPVVNVTVPEPAAPVINITVPEREVKVSVNIPPEDLAAKRGLIEALGAHIRAFAEGLKGYVTRHELALTLQHGKTQKTITMPDGRAFKLTEEDKL